jgi:hypothetical protein
MSSANQESERFTCMSVHELIEFVQGNYSSQGVPKRDPNGSYDRAPDDLNAIQGERPPVPDWLPEEDDASVIPVGGEDALCLEEELPSAGTEGGRASNSVTIDTLAYYLPYHFYESRWGIYLKTSGILLVGSLLKDGSLSLGDDDLLQLARRILFEHEFFHFVAETACARAEVVAKTRLYDVYYPHRYAAPHEEALANAHSFRRALVGQPPHIKKIVSTWMDGQGHGYRDYRLWKGRKRFDEGCRRSAHYMLQPLGTVALPSAATRVGRGAGSRRGAGSVAPADFLFAMPTRRSVPICLVHDDTRVGILKALPIYAGMRVWAHTREHPPPHFHIYRPPEMHLTRYLWPWRQLTPFPGDYKLSRSEERILRRYLEKHGGKLDEEMQFKSPMPPGRPSS